MVLSLSIAFVLSNGYNTRQRSARRTQDHAQSAHSIDFDLEQTQTAKRTRRECEICGERHWQSRCPHKCICGVGSTHNINGCPNMCDCGQGRPHMPNDCPQNHARRRCEICNGLNHSATMCPHKCNCNIGSVHNINDCPNICGCGETPTHSTVNCRFIMHLTLLSEVIMLAI